MKKVTILLLAGILSLALFTLVAAQDEPQAEQAAGNLTAAQDEPQAEQAAGNLTAAQDEPQAEQAAGEAIFQVGRLVIAGSVDNLEPMGVFDAFAASTEKVYCFLEARQIMEDTTAHFVWYHGETQTADVALPLRKGARWRTYSSKKLGGRTGDWRVEIQDAEGNVLEVVGFAVE